MTQPLIPDDTSPAQAFDAMSRRLAGLIASVDGFAARQQELLGRDSSEDLARIDDRCVKLRQALVAMNNRPAMALTPERIAEQIESAGRTTREADHRAWQAAYGQLAETIGAMTDRIDSARTADRQNWWLTGVGCVALILGIAIGDTVPVMIDHVVPETWYWPEARAAAVLQRDGWGAGIRLIEVAEPKRWEALAAADALLRDNAKELAHCKKAVARKGKPVDCKFRVASVTALGGAP